MNQTSKPALQAIAQEIERYLQLARLTPPSLMLLLPLAPALGALVLAANGRPPAGAMLGLLLATLALWGLAWGFNDLVNARQDDQAHSLIRRGVRTASQAALLLAFFVLATLLITFLLGWRFGTLVPFAVLVAFTYPWLRKRTYLIEAWAGLGIAWTVPLAYAALGRWPDKVGALLGVVTLLWTMGWKVLQQWPHQASLLERGMRSLGLMFGPATGHLVIAVQLTVVLGGWMAGTQGNFGAAFHWLWLVSAAAIVWEAVLIHKQGSRVAPPALALHLLSGALLWAGVVLHFAIAA